MSAENSILPAGEREQDYLSLARWCHERDHSDEFGTGIAIGVTLASLYPEWARHMAGGAADLGERLSGENPFAGAARDILRACPIAPIEVPR